MCDYIKTILVHDVVVEGSKLNKNINNTISSLLKNKIEKKCLDKGYVREDSIDIIKRSAGMFSGSLFNGSVKYRVVFSCDLCNPSKGDRIRCKVNKVNELGLRGSIGPIKVIVAKQFQDNVTVFKNIKEGDEIDVVILDKKFDLNSAFIEVAAKIDEDKIFKNLEKNIEVVNMKMDKSNKKFVLSSLEDLVDFNSIDVNDIAEELDISDSDEYDELTGTNDSEVNEEKLEQNEKVLAYENITGKNNVNLQTTSINISGENPNEIEDEAKEESDEEEESEEESEEEDIEDEESDEELKDEDEEDSEEDMIDNIEYNGKDEELDTEEEVDEL
jgi:DNA-directed RNA polymerase subunit E'/Rpb7